MARCSALHLSLSAVPIWSTFTLCINPGHSNEITITLKTSTEIEAGDSHLKLAGQNSWFSSYRCRRPSANGWQHERIHDICRYALTGMIDNTRFIHVTVDRRQCDLFGPIAMNTKLGTRWIDLTYLWQNFVFSGSDCKSWMGLSPLTKLLAVRENDRSVCCSVSAE